MRIHRQNRAIIDTRRGADIAFDVENLTGCFAYRLLTLSELIVAKFANKAKAFVASLMPRQTAFALAA